MCVSILKTESTTKITFRIDRKEKNCLYTTNYSIETQIFFFIIGMIESCACMGDGIKCHSVNVSTEGNTTYKNLPDVIPLILNRINLIARIFLTNLYF